MLMYKAFAPFRCTSVPSWGGACSGGFFKTGDSSNNPTGVLYPFCAIHLKAF